MHPRLAGALFLVVCCLALPASASAQQTLWGAEAEGSLSNLYTLDPATGAIIDTIGPIGFSVTGMAVNPGDGTLYGTTGREAGDGVLITIDKTTGAGALVGDLFKGSDETAADITFREGTLFGFIEPDSDDLATIDTTTGAASIVGDAGLSTAGSGLAARSDGTIFYSGHGDAGELRTLDPSTGAATVVATMDGDQGEPIRALAFDASDTLFGVRRDGETRPTDLIKIDTTSGQIEVVGAAGGGELDELDAIAFEPPPPPEPEPEPEPQPAPPPTQPVAAPPARDTARPSVRIAGVRSRCVSRNFRVRVRASDAVGIRRVRVFLDGRRIRSTTRRTFSVTIGARRLRAGRHRITIQATDTSGNVRRTTRRFARCAQAAPRRRAAPRFTG